MTIVQKFLMISKVSKSKLFDWSLKYILYFYHSYFEDPYYYSNYNYVGSKTIHHPPTLPLLPRPQKKITHTHQINA